MHTSGKRAEFAQGVSLHRDWPWFFLWDRLVLERGLTFVTKDDWDTSAEEFNTGAGLVNVLMEYRMDEDSVRVIIESCEVLALVSFHRNGGSVSVYAACRHHAKRRAQELIDELRRALPPTNSAEIVPIRFWMVDHKNMVQTRTRELTCPTWDAISANYHRSTSTQLEKLMCSTTAPSGGQLILWHGLPGTGKTWALQALARSWKPWCRIDYITDPEKFLGAAHYLIESVIDRASARKPGQTHRLFVLEDTGELLSADAKTRVGNALTRFLNVVDGLIGRALPIMILVTSNEELGTLHPAVARPGRCADVIEFKPLTAQEASAWLRTHGDLNCEASSPTTLADLYAESARSTRRTPRARPIGFLSEQHA